MNAPHVQRRVANLHRRVHEGCFVCDPANPIGIGLEFVRHADESVSAPFCCAPAYGGYRGLVHGGVLASIIDGAMTNCLFSSGRACLTADLQVRYRLPVRLDTRATVQARISRCSPPLYILAAEIVQDGQVKVRATGKFLEIGQIGAEP